MKRNQGISETVFSSHDPSREIKTILDKAEQHVPLSRSDMEFLLGLSELDQAQEVFETTRRLRERFFGNRVFLYGFLYANTYCRNSCSFCLYQKNNPAAIRYRKSQAQILEACQRLSESGVHLIDLTMGEDPEVFDRGDQGFDLVLDTIRSVKQATGLPMMISTGVLPESVLTRLPEAGAVWYSCYQETHNRQLYKQLRPGQDYDTRMDSKRMAKKHGMLVEEGFLAGVGESATDIADEIFAMRQIGADQVRVMSLVPQKGTPMERRPPPNPLQELLIIALLRLVFPDLLIPASLDVGGHSELGRKLAAGANVVTSLIPPGQELAGVAQSELDIEEGKRTVAGIQDILIDLGLEQASSQEYESWIKQRLNAGPPIPCVAAG